MSICPESAKRAAMSDGEFWDYVWPQPLEFEEPPGWEGFEHFDTGCPVCGAVSECAVDADGHPLIHATPD